MKVLVFNYKIFKHVSDMIILRFDMQNNLPYSISSKKAQTSPIPIPTAFQKCYDVFR